MTPEKKAIELRDKFYFNTSLTDLEEIKKCALIVLDELLNNVENSYYNLDLIKGAKLYYNEVKKEIEKICI